MPLLIEHLKGAETRTSRASRCSPGTASCSAGTPSTTPTCRDCAPVGQDRCWGGVMASGPAEVGNARTGGRGSRRRSGRGAPGRGGRRGDHRHRRRTACRGAIRRPAPLGLPVGAGPESAAAAAVPTPRTGRRPPPMRSARGSRASTDRPPPFLLHERPDDARCLHRLPGRGRRDRRRDPAAQDRCRGRPPSGPKAAAISPGQPVAPPRERIWLSASGWWSAMPARAGASASSHPVTY